MTKNLILMDALVEKMHYYEERQKLLSKNIANINTVGYKSGDLKASNFKDLLKGSSSNISVSPAITNSKHIGLNSSSNNSKSPYKTIRSNKGVELQEELLKMNKNYTDHRLATSLYRKSIEMLKSAIRSR